MKELRVADAITEIFVCSNAATNTSMRQCRGHLQKDEAKKDRLETVLYNLIESIKTGAKLLESFMPETSEKILAQLGDGKVTEKPEILFARLDVNEVMKKVEELHPNVERRKRQKKKNEEVIDIEASRKKKKIKDRRVRKLEAKRKDESLIDVIGIKIPHIT